MVCCVIIRDCWASGRLHRSLSWTNYQDGADSSDAYSTLGDQITHNHESDLFTASTQRLYGCRRSFSFCLSASRRVMSSATGVAALFEYGLAAIVLMFCGSSCSAQGRPWATSSD